MLRFGKDKLFENFFVLRFSESNSFPKVQSIGQNVRFIPENEWSFVSLEKLLSQDSLYFQGNILFDASKQAWIRK